MEKDGGLWEGGYIGEILVWDYRKIEYDNNFYFDYYYWFGNFK